MKKLLILMLFSVFALSAFNQNNTVIEPKIDAQTIQGSDTSDFVRTAAPLKVLSDGTNGQLMKFNGDGTISPITSAAGSNAILKIDPTNPSKVIYYRADDTVTGSTGHTHTEYPLLSSVNTGISKITYNEAEKTLNITTGVSGTTNQLGTELWNNLVVNNSGAQIDNGKAVYAIGIQGDSIMEIALASNTSSSLAGRTLGLATGDIPDGGYGFVTRYGYVRDFNTSALNLTGGVYLGTNGDLTMTKPTPPSVVKVMGGLIYSHASDGIFTVAMSDIAERIITGKGYNFTSNGVGAGTFWKGGFYDWSATDANLNEGSTTVTYGTADDGYSAHGSVVCGGAGSVNTGVVGLRVTGTSITDAGVLTPGDADTIISDITAVATDEFYEAKKFVGTTTYELITMSGSPTTYSLDFNYGYSKYEDLGNRDFYLTGLECIWQGGAADATTFDIILLHHKTTGWTYAASGFVAGDGSIAQRSVDQAGFLRVENGVDGAWKRTNINQFINGNGSEGIMFKIITGANGTIQTMDMHIIVAID